MHLDPDLSLADKLPDVARRRLQQIADALGCRITDFFGPPSPRFDLAAAAELLELWLAATDGDGRAKLLDCAREFASVDEGCKAVAG